jgi:hypothetical protein
MAQQNTYSCDTSIQDIINKLNPIIDSDSIVKDQSFIDNISGQEMVFDARYDQNILLKLQLIIRFIKSRQGNKMNINIFNDILIKNVLDEYKYNGNIFKNINQCTNYIQIDLIQKKCYYNKKPLVDEYDDIANIDDGADVYKFAKYLTKISDDCGPYILISVRVIAKSGAHATSLIIENRKILGIGNDYFGIYYDSLGINSGGNNTELINGVYNFFKKITYVTSKINFQSFNVSCPIGIQSYVSDKYDIGFCETYSMFWLDSLFRCMIKNILSKANLTKSDTIENYSPAIENRITKLYSDKKIVYNIIVNYASYIITLYYKYYPENQDRINYYKNVIYSSYFNEYSDAFPIGALPKIKNIQERKDTIDKLVDNLIEDENKLLEQNKKDIELELFNLPDILSIRKKMALEELNYKEKIFQYMLIYQDKKHFSKEYLDKILEDKKAYTNYYFKKIELFSEDIEKGYKNIKNATINHINHKLEELNLIDEGISELNKKYLVVIGTMEKQSLKEELNKLKKQKMNINQEIKELKIKFDRLFDSVLNINRTNISMEE